MENEKAPLIFADGLNFQQVSPNAPESVRGKIYVDWKKFRAFCEEHVNERGYVNITMMKSLSKGSIYFIKDSFVPKTDTVATQEYNDTKYRHQDPQVQASNEKSAEQMFSRPMTEDEQFNLSRIPF